MIYTRPVRETIVDKPATATDGTLLTFVVGPYLLCASSTEVEGIISPPSIARLPNNHPCMRGIFFHHGHTALVIDLRCLFGLPHRTHQTSGELILTRIRGELAAFWVDDVLDVTEAHTANWRETPRALANGVFERFAVIDQDLYLYTHFGKLLDADPQQLVDALRAIAPAAVEITEKTGAPVSPPAIGETAAEQAPAIPAPATTESISPVVTLATRRTPVTNAGTVSLQPRRRTVANITNERAVRASRLAAATYTAAPAARVTLPQASTNRLENPQTGAAPAHDTPRNKQDSTPWLIFAGIAVVLLAGFLWWWLGTDTRPDARTASRVADSGLSPERISTPPPVASPPAVVPATSDPAQILRVDTSEFTLTVERPAPTEHSPPAPIAAAPTPPPAAKQATGSGSGQVEIVHVVKRGDTLWDITRKHLGNPFRYPELARLSNIRNPDLIYPGDRIRIVRKTPAAR